MMEALLKQSPTPTISLHKYQSPMFKDLFITHAARFAVGVCARGWGKSFFAAVAAWTACRELMLLGPNVPNKNVYIVAPTFDQVKEIYYPLLAHQMGLESYAVNCSQDRGYFEFPGNVWLRLVSYEAIERMRGKGAYFVIMDEVSSWERGPGLKVAWQKIIEPCIRTRWSPKLAKQYGAVSPGRAVFISTPKGYNFLHDLFHYFETDDEWKSYHYDYTKSKYLDPDEIERVKHRIDPVEWASEYLAQFKDSGFSVFYNFDRDIHVRKDIPYFQEDEVVHAGIDFNVGIMACSTFAVRGDQIHYMEDFRGSPNTPTLITTLQQKYPGKKIVVYPDPTGKARKTSAAIGETDLSLLGAAFTVHCREGSPKLVDSVQAVNRKLLTAAGTSSMFFRPEAVDTIMSMERTNWMNRNSDLMQIDKTEGHEHWSDQVRYSTEWLFPAIEQSVIIGQRSTF